MLVSWELCPHRHLLTTQLEAQRAVHENRLLVSQRECGSRVRAAEAEQHEALTTLTELQRESNAITKEFSDRQRKIARLAVLLEKVSTPSKDEAEMVSMTNNRSRFCCVSRSL